MQDSRSLEKIILLLREQIKLFTPTLVDQIITEFGHDPYLILISCLLSLRAKDSTTIHVCRELFTRVKTPQQMVDLSLCELEKIIFKTGFYRNKAMVLKHVSQVLVATYAGTVPSSMEQLLKIKGIGSKTANLVLGMAFKIPSICVDTHVHRISNRFGLISTKSVDETEKNLKMVIPRNLWIEWNKLLVIWGQNICHPVSPKCSVCVIRPYCKRVGVLKSR